MHDLGIAVDHHVFCNLNRIKIRNFTEVISAEIDEHIVFGKFFFVGKQILFQNLVLLRCCASRSGTGYRECSQAAIFQTDQRFRGSTHDLFTVNAQVHHVRRRICGTQYTVRVDQAALVRSGELS